MIIQLVKELDDFCFLNYEQTPSKHWKYVPLAEYEEFDSDMEIQRIKGLNEKAKTLEPLYIEVKEILSRYHIDLEELNIKAREFHQAKEEEKSTK